MEFTWFLVAVFLLLVVAFMSYMMFKDRKTKFSKSLRALDVNTFNNPHYAKAKLMENSEKERIVAILKCAKDYTLNIDLYYQSGRSFVYFRDAPQSGRIA